MLIVAPVVIIALGAVHDADVVRARGAGVVVERRHRPRLRHQRQAHVDDRVDDRRPRSRRSPAILVAPLLGVTPGNIVAAGAVAIGPSLLLRALVVALIARMQSLPMTIVGGIAVGVFERIVLANVDARDQSIVDLYLFVAALVLVLFVVRNRRDDDGLVAVGPGEADPGAAALALVRAAPARRSASSLLFGFFAILPLFLVAAIAGVPLDRDRHLRARRAVDHAARRLGRASSRSGSSRSSVSARSRW